MKKLVQAQNGGFPYQNEDIYGILQNEQFDAYSGFYKAITNNATSGNTGVILYGCNVNAFDGLNYIINFQNSLIYLDNEFLKPDDTINNAIGISGDFYLIPTTPVITQRIYRDNVSKNATTERRFTWTNTLPSTGQYIKFSDGGSGRFVKTIVKNFTTETGTIVQLTNISKFLANGLGFNEWDGWALCNGSNGTVNLKGKFIIGYDSASPTSPTSNPSPTQTNYGLINNIGGLNSVTLTEAQLPVVDKTIQATIRNIVTGVRLTTGGSGGVDKVLRVWDDIDTNRIYNIPNESDIQTRVTFGGGNLIENRPSYIVLAFAQKI
jgi:hypothetical protein